MVTTNDSLAILYTRVSYASVKKSKNQKLTFFFFLRSLEEMTQEGLEEIFAQYAQTIDAFRPVKQSNYHYEDDLFEDEDDGQGDDLWIAEDEEVEPAPAPPIIVESTLLPTAPPTTCLDSIFSQPNATLSNESIEFPMRSPSPLSEKPLPANPILNDDTAKQARRKSGFGGGVNKNRLSWTSDTGITSSVVSQNLANEIMSLFDMDFAVDIKVDTAPKLPELPFKPRARSQQRQSQDMLTSLIPAFEKIALENSTDFLLQPQPSSVVPPPRSKPNLVIRSVPQRSSSLRHRQEVLNMENKSPITPPATPDSPVDTHSLIKKKSILRLASLMNTTKKKDLPASPDASPILQHETYFNTVEVITNTPRKTSTSTVDSSSSSSWSYVSDMERPQKPLPEPPNSPDFIPSVRDDFIISGDESSSKKHRTRKSLKKKRKSVLTKRKSNHTMLFEEEKGLSRSKSAFIKIGNGLKNKKQLKQIRRTSSAKNLTTESPYQFHYHTTNDVSLYEQEETPTSFVKRMTSFNWRIKPRQKPVVA